DVDDPHGAIAKMRCPGLMVCPVDGGPYEAVAYEEIRVGVGVHILRIPRCRFTAPLRYTLCADLFETGAEFQPPDCIIKPGAANQLRRSLTVPRYEAPPRPKNLQYVKLGIPDGLRLEQRIAMSDAYTALAAKERAAGFGFLEQTRKSWWRFLVNYFRPYAPKGYTEPGRQAR